MQGVVKKAGGSKRAYQSRHPAGCLAEHMDKNRKPSLVAEVLQHHLLRFNADAFACLFVILAESAIDCCAVNGLLIPHLFHVPLLSWNKVNPEIVRFLLLYRGICSPSIQQHLTKILLQRHLPDFACLRNTREQSA